MGMRTGSISRKPRRGKGAFAPLVSDGASRFDLAVPHPALSRTASVVALVVGWSVIHQNEPLSRLANVIVEDEAFEIGLRAMVAGIGDS